MLYTTDIRRKLDAILKAFEKYINSQNYFDIVYSQKIGYVKILVEDPGDEGAELLDTPEKMLDVLFNEVINDVVFSPDNRYHIPNSLALSKYEENESRRQLTAILTTIEGDGTKYLEYLDAYIKDYQKRYAGDGESC